MLIEATSVVSILLDFDDFKVHYLLVDYLNAIVGTERKLQTVTPLLRLDQLDTLILL